MLNDITLIGRITKDIELRYTTTNKAVASFSLAVNRGYKNPQGETETDFINIEIWGTQAENTQKYCKKGDMIAVKGSLRIEQYTDKENNKRNKIYVLANLTRFLQTKANNTTQSQTNEIKPQNETVDPYENFGKQIEIKNEDLPF